MSPIGQLQEKSLHAALKAHYAGPGDSVETRVQGYIIDVVREDTLIEIQTGHFSALKPKLAHLLQTHAVRLVHPIAQERWIVRVSADGEVVSRRKSPRHGTVDLLFRELIRFPELIAHPNFTIEIVFTQEEEIWHNDGRGSWRRKRWSIADRRLLSVVEKITFETPEDFRALLPDSLPQPFTTADLAAARRCTRGLAQKMAFCLRQMRVIEILGKRGNALLYRVS
jgi:hypothetical protein